MMTANVINVTTLCLSAAGMVLLVAYFRFAYSMIHQEDLLAVQKWKSAIGFAAVLCFVLLAFFLRSPISAILKNSSVIDTVDLIEFVIVTILSTLAYVIPILFVITVGMYYLLRGWRKSNGLVR